MEKERRVRDEPKVIVFVDEVEIFDSDFELAIAEACEKFEIENLKTEGQRRWKAVMQYVGERVFTDRRILKDKNLDFWKDNPIATNNNRYNHKLLLSLCDYYIYLSNIYNKLVSAVAFSLFVNLPVNTIDEWKYEESSSTRFQIWKKLQDNRLDCIKDKTYDNGNVTGSIALGNWDFCLSMPNAQPVRQERKVLTAKELPRLDGFKSED